MKKETIIAITFGILFGAVVALVIIAKNKQSQLQQNKTINMQTTITPIVSGKNNDLAILEITAPVDGAITSKNSISITGKAPKNSVIVIQSPIRDLILQTDNGTFKTDYPLALGENTIQISSYEKGGQNRSQEKEIRVYYLNEQL